MTALRILAAIVGVSSLSAQTHVWVVNDDGPADFADLQPAIDAASSGDILLVKRGTYGGMDVAGKTLTIQADRNALGTVVVSVEATGASRNRIRDLAPGQSVRVRGLLLADSPSGLELTNNAGTVWVEDCQVSCLTEGSENPGLSVSDSSAVVLIRSSFLGADGADCDDDFATAVPGPGLRVANAQVHAFGCSFQGGSAGTYVDFCCPFMCLPVDGADGIRSSSAQDFLFLSGCTVQGTYGSSEFFEVGCFSGSAGAGLVAAGVASVLDSVVQGGPAKTGFCAAAAGPDTVGPVDFLPGRAMQMQLDSPVRENGTIDVAFFGPAGAQVWMRARLNPEPAFVGAMGSLLVPEPGALQFMGTIGSTGVLFRAIPLGNLPPGVQGRVIFAQGLYLDMSARLEQQHPTRTILGEGSMLVELDEAP